MTDEFLVALLGGRAIGRVRRDRRNRLSFAYDEEWRSATPNYPLYRTACQPKRENSKSGFGKDALDRPIIGKNRRSHREAGSRYRKTIYRVSSLRAFLSD